jgi:hypothetical protein
MEPPPQGEKRGMKKERNERGRKRKKAEGL